MKDIRQDENAGKTPQPSEISEPALNAKDLTCQEAQIDALLSKGESTGGDADEERADIPSGPNPPQ